MPDRRSRPAQALLLGVAFVAAVAFPAGAGSPLGGLTASGPQARHGGEAPLGDPGALMRAGDWAGAERAAAAVSDPLAVTLVRLRRLLSPGMATEAEIAAFIVAHPTWPFAAALARRRDEALASDPDDAAALQACDMTAPAVAQPAARLRCADAYARAGRTADAARQLRRAWIDGPSDPGWEAATMQREAGVVTADDQWRRFDRLGWTDLAGARRQLVRLAIADRPRAEARLALKRDDPTGPALVALLPPTQRIEPALVLEQLRWLGRAGRDADEATLWRDGGATAERAAPLDHRLAFWTERNALARRMLRSGDAAGAYALAAGHAQTAPEPVADAEFLAGFIALRRLGDPGAARRHFTTLARVSTAPITQARAHFWLARAAAAQSDAAAAQAEYRLAAAYPTTFYGQLAAIALGEGAAQAAHLAAARDPTPDPAEAVAFAARELTRAAILLAGWGEPRLAASFAVKLADDPTDPAGQAQAARLAQALCPPDVAVAIARRVARDGLVLVETGWPLAADVAPEAGVDPALALGIMRQESSFDASVVSPAGARGLMQLMPATATATARQIGAAAALTSPTALTADPALNVRLGTAYLRTLLDRFGGAVPLAAAAYNAGPGRVADWLAANGDPRAGADTLDWIELIGFSETRNYVERVVENTVIYRARRGEAFEHPLAPWQP